MWISIKRKPQADFCVFLSSPDKCPRQRLPTRKLLSASTHFKFAKVWDTIYPTRHDLYFVASQMPIEQFGQL